MEAFGKLLSVVVLSVLAIVALAWSFRSDFIYLFVQDGAPPADIARTSEKQLPAFGDDPALTVWVTQPLPGQPVVVYFMGETGALSVHEPRFRDLADAGFGIAAMAYRGGGGQPGDPGEAAFNRDAMRLYAGLDTLFDQPVPGNDRVIYGYSLGTSIAVQLAAAQEELAVILEAPYTDLCAANMNMATLVPGCLLLAGNSHDALSHIDQIGAPLLILHGTADDRVPVELGQALMDAAEPPKFMETYQGGGHEDLARFGAVEDAVSFIRTLRGVR